MRANEKSPAKPGRAGFACEPMSLLRLREVTRRTGKSRSSVYRDVAAGTFPAPVKLGERASAWPAAEVDRWIADRIAARDEGRAANDAAGGDA